MSSLSLIQVVEAPSTHVSTITRMPQEPEWIPVDWIRPTNATHHVDVFKLPNVPIVVVYIGRSYYIADGNHRFVADVIQRRKRVLAWVMTEQNRRDAYSHVDKSTAHWIVAKTSWAEFKRQLRVAYADMPKESVLKLGSVLRKRKRRVKRRVAFDDSVLKRAAAYVAKIKLEELMLTQMEALGYRSVVDWMLCRFVPSLADQCKRFYRGEGPALRDCVSNEEREQLDELLLAAIKQAYEGKKRS